jgi:GT2 family glycosyltransferase
MPKSAAIICTRNRPNALPRTLASIQRQANDGSVLLILVDASEPEIAKKNKALLAQPATLQNQYLRYHGEPSLTRQRNYGIDHLPSDVEIVFFLDDDVTLKPGYFNNLLGLLDQNPDLLGVGGLDVTQKVPDPLSIRRLLRYLFLLDHPRPGHVLPSGEASSPHRTQAGNPVSVQWLAGFSMAFRRSILEKERFDERLEGYAHYEDRDLSVRISRHGRLVTQPKARLIHRRSPKNRHTPERFTYSMMTHLYWFVEKNIHHSLRKPAFWWSVLGRFLALIFSAKQQKWDALRGLLRGIRSIATRSDPLLARQ